MLGDKSNDNALPCTSKAAYSTKKEAEAAAIVAKHQYGQSYKTYLCRYCDLWHLASDFDD